MNKIKNEINKLIDKYKNEGIELAKQLWEKPELAFQEYFAKQSIENALKKHEFKFKKSILDTAVIASYKSKKQAKKRIAIIGEYDALPTQTNNINFHGCGHNLFAGTGVLSAIILSKIIAKYDLDLEIVFYGTPAEEVGAGKNIMVKNKEFDNIDACFSWHPAAKNSIANDIWIESQIIEISFFSENTHASMILEGSNANELLIDFINEYRKIALPVSSYILINEKQALSVTPKIATIQIAIRSFNQKEIKNNLDKIKNILKNNMKDDQYKFTKLERYIKTRHDTSLQDTVYEAFKLFKKEPEYTKEEIVFAKDKLKSIDLKEKIKNVISMDLPEDWADKLFITDVRYWKEERLIYAPTDLGSIANIIPTIQFQTICVPLGVGLHTQLSNEFAGMSIGHKGLILASKITVASILLHIGFK